MFWQWCGDRRPWASACVGLYLRQLCGLILLQLLLEAVVGADEGADGLDGGQALVPPVVCDGHQVGHHHGGAPRDACQAAAKQHRFQTALVFLLSLFFVFHFEQTRRPWNLPVDEASSAVQATFVDEADALFKMLQSRKKRNSVINIIIMIYYYYIGLRLHRFDITEQKSG